MEYSSKSNQQSLHGHHVFKLANNHQFYRNFSYRLHVIVICSRTVADIGNAAIANHRCQFLPNVIFQFTITHNWSPLHCFHITANSAHHRNSRHHIIIDVAIR